MLSSIILVETHISMFKMCFEVLVKAEAHMDEDCDI